MTWVRIVEGPIDVEEARRHVARPANGAVLVFHGVVRDHHEGREVAGIHYQAYRAMALRELQAVADEAAFRHGVEDVAVVHRLGRLGVGEASLVVAVGSPHRKPAFEAAQALIDELKRRVPIWKKEWGPQGEHWVEGVTPPEPGRGEPERT